MSQATHPAPQAGAPLEDAGSLIAQVNLLCDALRQAREPAAALDAIGAATLRTLGPGLLTINAWHVQTARIERLWSSDTAAYPVGGHKTKGDSPWRRQLLERGEVFVGEGDDARPLEAREMGVLGGGGRLSLRAGDGGARLILVAGTPLREPVARHGPFVMNTRQELMQAFVDYQEGRF